MPGHRVFIETNRTGTPVFVRRPSHSHHRPSTSSSGSSHSSSYYPPRMGDERVHILRDEVERLRERERDLTYSYTQVLQQNERHKAEILRLQRIDSDRVAMIHRLQHENSDLRREADSANTSATRWQNKYREAKAKSEDMERENGILMVRIRELTQRVHVDTDRKVRELREQVDEWKRRYASSEKTLSRMRDNLDARIEDNTALKAENSSLSRENEILRRSLDTAKRMLNRHGLYIT